ncbi:CHASE2 domain-containing protein [Chloroflexota bacterium]
MRINISRRQSRRLIQTSIVLVVGCLFTLITVVVQPLTAINWRLSDQMFLPEAPSPNIVILAIDDETLKTYGKWSEWRRSLHAQAIDNLSKAGASIIAFDILFADSSSDDADLARAIENAGNVVIPVVGVDPLPPAKSGITYEQFIVPTGPLEQASLSLGHANVVPDGDGIVRRVPMLAVDTSGQAYPAFSLAILHALFSQPLPDEYIKQNNKLLLLGREIPVDHSNQLLVNFTSLDNSYVTLSYGDVIQGNFPQALVKNKIVLVGMAATAELDTWFVPVSATKVPGVWIHANAMDTVLRQRFLIDIDWAIIMWLMLLITVISALALPRMKLRWGGVLIFGMLAGYFLAVFIAFDSGYVFNILYPAMLLPIVYFSSVFCVVVSEQSDKRLIKDLFGRYVSPQVATEILELTDAGRLELGGEQRIVSVLFADMRGFTQMSEKMSPKEVIDMLNNYLSIAIEKVLQNDGMINKFAGDNIMAIWNAPKPLKEHALLAVKAAYEAQAAITEYQQNDTSQLKVQFGIGINTGEAVAGNMGSLGRAEYTVIGDSVNLASRLCGAAPGGEVWIGQETYNLVKDHIDVEKLEPQYFKGKSEPVTVYRVTGLRKSST